MKLSEEIKQIVDTCIHFYDDYFSIERNNYLDTEENIIINSEEFLDDIKNEIAKSIVPIVENKEKKYLYCASFISYGYYVSAYNDKGNISIFEGQKRYEMKNINPYIVDDILNYDGLSNEDNASAMTKWCNDPEGNVYSENPIFKRMVGSVLKDLSKKILPNKTLVYNIVLPPFAKKLNFDLDILKEAGSKYMPKGSIINILDYSCLIEDIKKNIIYYQCIYSNGKFGEILTISSYEMVRGSIRCNGTLSFDINSNKRFELHSLERSKIFVQKQEKTKEKTEKNNYEIEWNCNPSRVESKQGYISFLATHSADFFNKSYLSLEDIEISNKCSLDHGHIASPCLLYTKGYGEENLKNIPLVDLIWISDEIEKNPKMMCIDPKSKKETVLGDVPDLLREVSKKKIYEIPSNYASIRWKLKDKKNVSLDYWNMPDKYSIEDFIYAFLKKDDCTTDGIAEELLYDFDDNPDAIPSAFFVAAVFLKLSQMKNLVVRNTDSIIDGEIEKADVSEFHKVKHVVKPQVQKRMSSAPVKRTLSDISITDLGLSVRTYNSLKRAGIMNVKDISKYKTMEQLLKIRNLGKNGAKEIMVKTAKYGLKFTGI